MMDHEEKELVTYVRSHLLKNEERGWDALDNYILYLEYLDNDQLHREADVVYSEHNKGRVRCENKQHPREQCFIPDLHEAVGIILGLYKETGQLHDKNRYILQYYLAMTHAKMIVVDPSEA